MNSINETSDGEVAMKRNQILTEADLSMAERRRALHNQRRDWATQTEISPFYFCRPIIGNCITFEQFSLSYLIRNQEKRKDKPSNKKASSSLSSSSISSTV